MVHSSHSGLVDNTPDHVDLLSLFRGLYGSADRSSALYTI